jgi:CheY-like chemotaxis protein
MRNEPTCFLIDNDKDDQEIFSLALAEANPSLHFEAANNGLEGIRRLKEDTGFTPDYIFIDMNMPFMNGQECLREIRTIDRLQHIPVYIYSTAANPATMEQVRKSGASDFLVKPNSFTGLVELLQVLCNQKNAL